MTHRNAHFSLEDLTEFSLGRLQGDEAAVVERHVSECKPCCDTLLRISSTEDTFVELLKEARCDPDEESRSATGQSELSLGTAADGLPSDLALHPRYQVVELIGVGGMGTVYRAQHRVMERTVALKIINREMVNNPQAVERFHREVKAAARLSHVNIVTAHDAEQAGDVHFLIMEYVLGTDLSNVVKTRGPLSVGEACGYVCQVAAGLQHSHEHRMVHRDIKPHNLMLTPDGTVKILDFGLASLTEAPIEPAGTSVEIAELTDVGAIIGTPDFISPEQVSDARNVDIRSDLYSLGATLYFLLAGRPPFNEGSVAERLSSHVEKVPERIDKVRDDIVEEVADVIARMLSKDPSDRFQTPSELADALAPFVDKHRLNSNWPASTSDQKPRHGKRTLAWSGLALSALLTVAMAFGTVMYMATNKGTLIITTPDESVQVVVRGEDGEVVEVFTGSTIVRLPIGEYRIAMKSDRNDIALDKTHFALTRGSEETVFARLTQRVVRPKAKTPRPDPPATAVNVIKTMKFELIPAGQFSMGTQRHRKSTPSELRHRVHITKPFHMGKYEVTQQEYKWVIGQNPSAFSETGANRDLVTKLNTSRFPAERVSWKDAREFCRRLTVLPEARRAGYVYRLPTEAEWEYACRARTENTFHFAGGLNGTRANVDGKHPWEVSQKGPSLARTTTVGSYPSNAFGLCDMHGNVSEWCSDWFMVRYYKTSPQNDPRGPDAGSTRVVRGGSWGWGAIHSRCAARAQRAEDNRDSNMGFRVVRITRTPTPSPR